jgi:hypothetical protein
MRQAGTVTYWFCTGAAVLLILLGLLDTLFGGTGPGGILLFCLMTAAVFYLAGLWVLRRSAGSIE